MAMKPEVLRVILLIVALCGVARETSLFGSPSLLFRETRRLDSIALKSVERMDTTLDRIVAHSTSRGPNQDVAVCACAKCGSTALYLGMYEMIMNKKWNIEKSKRNCPQCLDREDLWENTFNDTKLSSTEELVDYLHKPSTFTFAVIRDPKERLISAWKSKVTCSTAWNTDLFDRKRLVSSLLELANLPLNKKCLSLTEYLRILVKIHQDDNAAKLDRHFLPQTENCFKHFSPEEWDVVTTVSAPMASEKLWNALQMKPTKEQLQTPIPRDFRSAHATGQSDLQLSSKQEEMLEYLTEKEYQAFGDFLPSKKNDKK